ncbi:FecR domain-containing protein [Aestuariibacter halophilus]|uniref:FecR domain-containing protein n=1 Tax=Fluctibacter halophilus TaxID=226011 RepID=A0ABS8G4P1_9ALTE|nr:FecR domain-containing protein [Aestuariibacter halophilus]MCC2615505.1 FecR domain-containing protein [Aestuariibacter halophilus]
MSNITAFHDREELLQQACEWISRIDRGLRPQEHQTLTQWVAKGNAHQQALYEAAALWDDLSVLNELKTLFPLRPKDNLRKRTFADRTRMAVAASVVFVVMFAASWLLNQQLVDNNIQTASTMTHAETGVGEQKPFTLPDGTVAHLNTDTEITLSFSDNARQVTLLRGEAHFAVAHDVNRPFTVTAGERAVTAVGTAFNVEMTSPEDFELLVTEGRVLVQHEAKTTPSVLQEWQSVVNQGKGILVSSGEKAVFDRHINPITKMSLDQVQQQLAWQQGMVVFNGESLQQVLDEVARYSAVQFELAEASLRERRVAGYFKAGDIDGLLYALENSFQIEHEKNTQGTIILSAKR